MGLGDMLGKAAGMLGGTDDIMGKIQELGIDPAELAGMDIDSVKSMLTEKGIDLSMLEGLGVDPEELLAKLTGGGE